MHNKLQSACFLWIWNEKPELRYLCFSTTNNLTTQLDRDGARARMAQMKSLGVIKGSTDLIFFYAGRMYGLDIKIGKDKLSKEQLEFIAALNRQGGAGCAIRSLESFQSEIDCILTNGCLTSEL